MYDHVLLPTDGSLGMATAYEQCFHQARLNEATVHALHVVDVRAYGMLPEDTQQQVRDLLIQEGQHALTYLEERAEGVGVEIVTELVEGVPHEVILGYVDRHDVDLVVMGTHGQTGEERRIVGSVAEAVVRHATVPVMTVRMRADDAAALEEDFPEEQRRYIS
ncbi:MAG: universal stress protein [Halanaeroarchaeum sp.]